MLLFTKTLFKLVLFEKSNSPIDVSQTYISSNSDLSSNDIVDIELAPKANIFNLSLLLISNEVKLLLFTFNNESSGLLLKSIELTFLVPAIINSINNGLLETSIELNLFVSDPPPKSSSAPPYQKYLNSELFDKSI